jgi:maleylacetate reductase
MEGLRLLAANLPAVVRAPRDQRARSDALLGAHYAGRALDMTSMGLEHKLAHILGGAFGLNHAEAHAALVPWVVTWNQPFAPEAMARIATALGAPDAGSGLAGLSRQLGIRPLSKLGLTNDAIPRVAELATALTFPNPRPVDAAGVRWIMERALRGEA